MKRRGITTQIAQRLLVVDRLSILNFPSAAWQLLTLFGLFTKPSVSSHRMVIQFTCLREYICLNGRLSDGEKLVDVWRQSA